MANQVFIKKSKMQYAEEVASIKPLEVFGVKACDVSWNKLFRKHLAFDVLNCGVDVCDDENCLKGVIGDDCNC